MLNQNKIVITDIEYTIEWDSLRCVCIRQSNYTVDGKRMTCVDLSDGKNPPPFTENQLKKAYKKFIDE